ncbi:MAG: hypothetical protein CL780_01910 [Chloroflexi bacterium]|nr:hypothetical protein [Chloroflexota bacterium]
MSSLTFKIYSRLIVPIFKRSFFLMLIYKRFFSLSSIKARFIRTEFIKREATSLIKTLNLLDYHGTFLINKNSFYLYSEGIFLNTKYSNRYIKSTDNHINEGYRISKFLRQEGVKLNNILDIGAYAGELSLFFSKNFPNANVIALEPSSKNFDLLKSNLDFNKEILGEEKFNKLTILKFAISDRSGRIDITSDFGGENTIILDSANKQIKKYKLASKETVDVLTIENIMEIQKVNYFDFIKIDIEGAEPLLTASLIKIKPKSILLEFSNKNEIYEYKEMFHQLINHGYKAILKTNDKTIFNKNNIDKFDYLLDKIYEEIFWGTLASGEDIWFIKSE